MYTTKFDMHNSPPFNVNSAQRIHLSDRSIFDKTKELVHAATTATRNGSRARLRLFLGVNI